MFSEMFERYKQLIDRYLDGQLPSEGTQPIPIYRAMRYSLFAGGKRLRPGLVLLAAEGLGGNPEYVLPAAVSIEMIHTYSLIHDDLPSMDNDDFRRGKPTSHKVFGEAIAILAGDALLTSAFGILSNAPYSSEIRCRLVSELAKAAGTQGMIGGQVLDIQGGANTSSRVELEKVHAMKTASLIAFSAKMPAIILEKGNDVEMCFSRYGESVGLAFQIVDDILDVEGTTLSLGKTANKDQHANKATYPALMGLQESKKLASDLIAEGIQYVAEFDQTGGLRAFAEFVLNRKR